MKLKIGNIIEALEDKLQEQRDDILIKDLQIKELRSALNEAEKEIAEYKEKLKLSGVRE